jgi:hypothetical protein
MVFCLSTLLDLHKILCEEGEERKRERENDRERKREREEEEDVTEEEWT